MEAKVQAAEVIPSQTSVTLSPALSSEERADSPLQPQASAEALPDPSEEFSRQLENIISTYGSAASLMEKKMPLMLEPDSEMASETDDGYVMVGKETRGGAKVQLTKGLGKEASLLMQSLNTLKTPQEKLDAVIKKYADMVEERRGEQRQLKFLQQKQGHMTKERDLFQVEHNRDVLARCSLEELCRELQKYNKTLKEESLQRSRQDEEKREEISCHFQTTLTEIQAQIEQHSNRNNKLCQENAHLADKLKSIISQYEAREESLEKIFKHRDLQQKLADAKVEQANVLLQEAQEKHKREREYLLREAIDKTKKCCTMKEQELQLKKKLVLYSQKFEEFQTTLSKSNDVYASFKQEMEKMTKKMNKLDKESGVWKTRFEECNKTLVEMIDERSVKEKEFGFFTVKIDKLETLCQALQDERKVLYGKIKDIRMANSGQATDQQEDSIPGATASPGPLVASELQELEDEEPALTEEMARLKVEQTRLQEFVTSLLNPSTVAGPDDDDDESDREEEKEGTAQSQSQPEVKVQTEPKPQLEAQGQKPSDPTVVPEQVEAIRPSVEPPAAEPVPTNPVPEPKQEQTPAVPQTQQPPEPLPAPQPVNQAVESTEPPTPAEVKELGEPTPAAPKPEEKTHEPSGPMPESMPETVPTAASSSSSSSKNTKTKNSTQSQSAKAGSKRQTPKKKNAKKTS